MSTTAVRFALTDEQEHAADTLLDRVDSQQVQTLGGYAGTGKTTMTRTLAERMPGWGVMAFTGKAADVLRRKGMLSANTIHGTIYTPVQTPRGVSWVLKPEEAIGHKGFLVDEASMVGRDIFRDLLSYGLPVIAIGDHGQLPPVGEDAGLMRNPDVRLETVHRNAGPIAMFAEHLRRGRPADQWTPDADGVVRLTRSASNDDLAAADQVICAFNRTRVGLNRTIRRLHGREGDEPQVGDRVICLQNDRTAGVFNGQQGVIKELDTKRREMLFDHGSGPGIWVDYHPAAWNAEKPPQRDRNTRPGEKIPFDFAYAVTAHKSQGDEWGNVIVYEEKCDLWEHSRWAYTAASRAKGSLLWVTR